MWWYGLHDWSTAIEGYRLLRKDRLGRWGDGLALFVREQPKSVELCFGTCQKPGKSLWAKVSGQTGLCAVVVDIFYRHPDLVIDLLNLFAYLLMVSSNPTVYFCDCTCLISHFRLLYMRSR